MGWIYKLSACLVMVGVVSCSPTLPTPTTIPATESPVPTVTSTETPTITPSPTAIPYGGGGIPLVAYFGGNDEQIELIIGDAFNNQIYYSIPLARSFNIVGEYPYAEWYGTMPLAWSPDGRELLFVDQCGETTSLSVCSYDLLADTIREITPLAAEITYVDHISFAPENDWIAYETREGNGSYVSLVNRNDGAARRFPNASMPKWDPENPVLYFSSSNNLSLWSSFDTVSGLTQAVNMRCHSAEFGENRSNWSCVNYIPELHASLVQQDNSDNTAYLILIDINGEWEKLICTTYCNSNFMNYDLLVAPDNDHLLFMSDSTRMDWQRTLPRTLESPDGILGTNLLHGVVWAPDSESYFVYRDEDSLLEKPLLLMNETGTTILYEYHFPTSSWGIAKSVSGNYQGLDVYWPASYDQEEEIYDTIVGRSQARAAASNSSTSGFAQWIPQLQAWSFTCWSSSWSTFPEEELIEGELKVIARIKDCVFNDVDGNHQSIDIGVVFDLPLFLTWSGAEHIEEPVLLAGGENFYLEPNLRQQYFLNLVGKEQFPVAVTVVFGLPNRANKIFYLGWDLPFFTNFRTPHFEYLTKLYSLDQLAEFAQTGNPDLLDGLLVPIMTLGVNYSRLCDQPPGCINHLP